MGIRCCFFDHDRDNSQRLSNRRSKESKEYAVFTYLNKDSLNLDPFVPLWFDRLE